LFLDHDESVGQFSFADDDDDDDDADYGKLFRFKLGVCLYV